MVPQKKRAPIILEKLFQDAEKIQQEENGSEWCKGKLTFFFLQHFQYHFIPFFSPTTSQLHWSPLSICFQAVGLFYSFCLECSSPSFLHNGLNFLLQVSIQMSTPLNSFTKSPNLKRAFHSMFCHQPFSFITLNSLLIVLFIYLCLPIRAGKLSVLFITVFPMPDSDRHILSVQKYLLIHSIDK